MDRTKPSTTDFEESVYAITKRIPRGSVSTYSDVAELLGSRGLARAVGNALGKNPYKDVPCYRVVRSDGVIGGYSAPGGSAVKARMLRDDGLEIRGLRILGLERYIVEPASLVAGGGAGKGGGSGTAKKGRGGGGTGTGPGEDDPMTPGEMIP